MTRSQTVIVGFFGFIILVLVLIFVGVIPGLKRTPPPPVPPTEITFWGFDSDESAWKNVIDSYQAARANIVVKYKGISERDYESTLLDNLAAGTGPDIMLIHNDWLTKHKNKLLQAPNFINTEQIAEIFPKTVSEDFVAARENQQEIKEVYALPISINTLALAYNRDYFDAKGAANAPQNWDEIKAIIPKLRELKDGKIQKSAIALGSSDKNIENASDVLTLLFLQKGIRSADQFTGTDSHGDFIFEKKGSEAIKFFLDFSDPKSQNFAFYEGSNEKAVDLLVSGKLAMMFVYPQNIKDILENKRADLNLKVVSMPQLDPDNPVNLADYWGLGFSKQTIKGQLAWDFINFATTNTAVAEKYASESKNSPALRSLIQKFNTDPILSVFAPQILNAKSFPKNNGVEFRNLLNDMVESSLKDRSMISKYAFDAIDRFRQIFK